MTTPPEWQRNQPQAYYPQQAYYAPGWQAPVQPAPPRSRRTLYTVLAVVGGLLVIGVLVGTVLGVRYWLDLRPLGEVDGPTTATARQLDAGHCLGELPPDGDVARVQVVPCSDPHVAEVVGVLQVRGDWRGEAAVEREALAYCEMDTAQQETGFRPVAWWPSERSWAQGDRRALCLAWLEDGTATGSFTGGDEVTTS